MGPILKFSEINPRFKPRRVDGIVDNHFTALQRHMSGSVDSVSYHRSTRSENVTHP